jgi:hypothetical protein
MINLIIAYAFIFIALVGYGVSLYRRTHQVNAALKREEK